MYAMSTQTHLCSANLVPIASVSPGVQRLYARKASIIRNIIWTLIVRSTMHTMSQCKKGNYRATHASIIGDFYGS